VKQYPHIVNKVFYEPWLITPGAYESICRVLEAKLAGVEPTVAYFNTNGTSADLTQVNLEEEFRGSNLEGHIDNNYIGHIPVQGILAHRIGKLERVSGATDYLDIRRETQKLLDSGAKGLMYCFDSSGGAVRGCQELADYIAGLPVPTAAFTDSKCSSAAYWLASACNHITATKTSDVGSIGVILPWIDKSKMWDMEGAEFKTFVNDGAILKGAGAGPGQLTKAQADNIQETLDFVGDQFQGFVKAHREGLNTRQVFKAGTYFGQQAKEVGLVDSVGSYTEAYDSLLARVSKSLVPAPMEANKKSGLIKGMTLEQLRADHPELFAQMAQETEAATKAAAQAAAETERLRLASLDELAFTPESRAIVDSAKKDGRKADQVAVEIAKLLARDNEHLATQVGVLKGMEPAKGIAAIDPNTNESEPSEKQLSNRVAAYFAKRNNITRN